MPKGWEYVMGFFDKLFGSKKPAKPEAVVADAAKGAVCAPVAGRVEVTDQIPDPVFACEAMGQTVAVWPSDGNVFAPISGAVASAMPHAFGIAGDDGVEVLVHVGVDTVNMNGDGFNVWVNAGDHVNAGDPVLTFDRDKVAKAGYKDIVMTIITNSDDLASIDKVAEGTVAAGAKLMQTA